jgi:hypothetical protein
MPLSKYRNIGIMAHIDAGKVRAHAAARMRMHAALTVLLRARVVFSRGAAPRRSSRCGAGQSRRPPSCHKKTTHDTPLSTKTKNTQTINHTTT